MMLRWSRRSRRDLACRDFVELVTDYMEGTMPAAERRRLDRHLQACPHCTRYLDQLRVVVTLTGRLTEDDVDTLGPTARAELLEAFAAFRESP
jgi:anti-sigma factor RsiW